MLFIRYVSILFFSTLRSNLKIRKYFFFIPTAVRKMHFYSLVRKQTALLLVNFETEGGKVKQSAERLNT